MNHTNSLGTGTVRSGTSIWNKFCCSAVAALAVAALQDRRNCARKKFDYTTISNLVIHYDKNGTDYQPRFVQFNVKIDFSGTPLVKCWQNRFFGEPAYSTYSNIEHKNT